MVLKSVLHRTKFAWLIKSFTTTRARANYHEDLHNDFTYHFTNETLSTMPTTQCISVANLQTTRKRDIHKIMNYDDEVFSNHFKEILLHSDTALPGNQQVYIIH